MAFLSLLLSFLFVPSATALFGASNDTDFCDDFANNFATDLAPIIALFGERVTKQFLSQSTTILDVVIFSVAPLGIITAVVSCIRVSNVAFLKSAVGRAREPHGIPEVELCTSTSENVCELWSNGGICRVFGRSRILEFIHKRPTDSKAYRAEYDDKGMDVPGKCSIESTLEIFNSGGRGKEQAQWKETSSYNFMLCKWLSGKEASIKPPKLDKQSEGKPDIEEALSGITNHHIQRNLSIVNRQSKSSPIDPEDQKGWQQKDDIQGGGPNKFAPFPNLALNIGVPRSSKEFGSLWFAAIIGILLQASFFVFATWATRYNTGFYEDGKVPSDPTWFVLTVTGTACIVIGMALCAQVIDGVSTERRFVHAGAERPRIYWLQPAGQRNGDQVFDGFTYSEAKSEYITSWKATQATVVKSWRVWLAITLSILGWVIQFIGLRGVHSSVALYQLAITLFMSAIRSILRSYHTPPNNHLSRILLSIDDQKTPNTLPDVYDDPFHYTIHWQSPQNNLILGNDYGKRIHGPTPRIIEWMASRSLQYWQEATTSEVFQALDNILESGIPYYSEPFPQHAVKMVRIRSRLAFLTNQPHYQTWDSEVRDMSRTLKSTLERTSRILATEGVFNSETRVFDSIVWSVGCQLNHSWGYGSKDIGLQQPLCFHLYRIGDVWNIDQYQLEAVLGLWLWAYDERHSQTERLQPGSKSCLASPGAQRTTRLLLLRWGVRPREVTSPIAHEAGIISVASAASMLNLMAQEVFTLFLKRIALTFDKEALLDTLYPDLDGPRGTRRSFVEDISQVLVAEGLATYEEAIMSIVPAFYRDSAFRKSGLPLELRLILKANSLKRQIRFDESEEALQSLMDFEVGGHSKDLAQQSFLELYRFQLRHMASNPRVYVFSELQLKAARLRRRLDIQPLYMRRSAYLTVAEFILAEASAANARQFNSRRTQSSGNSQKRPLDEENLSKLKLNTPGSLDSTIPIYALALTLRDKYDLETTDWRIRKALLCWAIVNGCTGLAEDLWDLEQWLGPADSAFSGGSDELLYAIVSPKSIADTMSMLLFLLHVTRVPTSGFSDGLVYVRILAASAVWSDEYLQEAVRAADESENSEIANYLRCKIGACEHYRRKNAIAYALRDPCQWDDTGKTKTFFAAVKMRQMLPERQPKSRKKNPNTFPIKAAKFEHRGARIHTLLGACRKPEEMLKPVNGRTIVFTTYPNLSKWWMRKREEPFNFKKDSDTSSKKKKATTDDEPKRLKRYFASSLELDGIGKLPKGHRGGADAVLLAPRSPQSSNPGRVRQQAIHDLKSLGSDVVGYVPGPYGGKYDAYQLNNEIIDESEQTLVMLPTEIVVEVCPYDEDDPDFELQAKDHSSEATMNFGEHRAGVITGCNPRTVKMLNPKTLTFYGKKKGMMNRIANLVDELPMTPTRTRHAKKIASGDEIVGLGVEHIDMLLKESHNSGLGYILQTCKQDPHLGPPTDRTAFVRLAARTPTFIRAMEHFDEFIRGQNLRVILAVETLWERNIQ
ncbi:uncharacterized protein FIESC28_02844 [Fusarium coffeatum]|uniref:Uncharacterized protein n=1 Tax=Fusarium coffeatum TaxID=231269 RepID=A0A366S4W2_9HYPO|nr:uncharacterized protein FIESC28_02844 [Fusarium coffeatum]RBR24354.1 hypothetical protein FIESC28_02844 [Fusarium coffeatum]